MLSGRGPLDGAVGWPGGLVEGMSWDGKKAEIRGVLVLHSTRRLLCYPFFTIEIIATGLMHQCLPLL